MEIAGVRTQGRGAAFENLFPNIFTVYNATEKNRNAFEVVAEQYATLFYSK